MTKRQCFSPVIACADKLAGEAPGERCVMLNEYHRQFLHHLMDHGVRFLIVGGQARHVHHGNTTRDLDLWVDIGVGNQPALEKALVEWSEEHLAHTAFPLTSPIAFAPHRQLKFPDADCWFMTRDDEPMQILALDGIDILTSIKAHSFPVFYGRAFRHSVDGMDLPFVSVDDLPLTCS
jgi:hypothetical protein